MSPRTLRTIGLVILTIGIFVYSLLVMVFANWLPPMHIALELLFYVFFGIVWIFPAYWLLKVTNKPEDND